MSDSYWLMNDVTSAMGWALVHSVWQGVAAAVVLAGLLPVLRHSGAGVRYLAACACLGAIAIAFAGTFWMKLPDTLAIDPAAGLGMSMPLPIEPVEPIAAELSKELPAVTSPPWTLDRAMPWVVAAWLMGVIVLSIWQFGGWMLLGRYRRLAEPADSVWAARLADVARRIGVKRAAMVITRRLDVPIVIGAFRPYILMPAAVLANLSIPQIEAILAHELAHVRRYDYLVNLIQSAIETLLFYHPAVWWISKQIRREREFACDEIAASVCGDRTTYARALAALEQSRVVRLAPAAGGGGRGELVERVRRVLNRPEVRREGRSRTWVAAGMVVMGCLAIGVWSRNLVAQSAPASPAQRNIEQPDAGAERPGSEIQPEDFVAPRGDYRLGANDLLQVKVADLVGPGIETVVTSRVSIEDGIISVPMIGSIKAAGLTEAELVHVIGMAYRDKNLIRQAVVSVVVLEAHGRTFSIMGAVHQPGQYAIVDPDLRLFNALVLARGTMANGDVRVIRPTDDPAQPRIIEIPGAAIAAGDPKINIVIRPRDVIVVTGPPSPTTSPAASRGSMGLSGPDTYSIAGRIRRSGVYMLSQRGTTLRAAIIGAGGAEEDARFVTVLRSYPRSEKRSIVANESLQDILSGRAADLLLQPDDEISLTTAPQVNNNPPSREGEYYLGGKVVRGGVYALNPHGVTLRAAIVVAGGPDVGGNFVTIIRRMNGEQRFVLRDEALNGIMDASKADVVLQADDEIMITERVDPDRPTTLPAVRGVGPTANRPANTPEVQQALDAAVMAAQKAWDDLERRFDAGEAYTPAMVQLQLDLAQRIFETRRAAASSPADELAAAEAYLKKCVELGEVLKQRQGQDVTQVQISQASSTIAQARALVLRLRAQAQASTQPRP